MSLVPDLTAGQKAAIVMDLPHAAKGSRPHCNSQGKRKRGHPKNPVLAEAKEVEKDDLYSPQDRVRVIEKNILVKLQKFGCFLLKHARTALDSLAQR